MGRKLSIIFIVVVSIFLIGGTCHAESANYYTVSLGSSISGNTTASISSSTSPFAIISGHNVVPRSGVSAVSISNCKSGATAVFQLTGVTPSIQQRSWGGDYSGNTITIVAKESLINEAKYWKTANGVTLYNAVAMNSGATPAPVQFIPNGNGFIRFELVLSQVTPYDGMTGIFSIKQ